jgi:hypothetical protein
MPLILRPAAFVILWITSVIGWKKAAPTTVTVSLWALGVVLAAPTRQPCKVWPAGCVEQVAPVILDTTSPRAWAFTLIGIHEYLRRFAGDRMVNQVRDELAGRLLTLYQRCRTDEWRWYEEGLTYCNAVLPQAMLLCGQWIPNNAIPTSDWNPSPG